MTWSKAKTALAIVLLALTSAAMAAKGKVGFATEATVSGGYFKPVLERLKIKSVTAGSPAAAAGVKPGDDIVEVNGRVVEGAPAREMKDQFSDLQPGQRLILKLKRGDAFVTAEIVAGP